MTVKIDTDSKPPVLTMIEVVKQPELEPKVIGDSELEPKVVTELVPLQKEIFSQLTDIEELSIVTLVDLPAELIMELFSLAMIVSLIIFEIV